ncbi:heavy metal translocating P-type ATPase [Rhodovulum sp. YNF3179]|uniref:heavy metal translocating P-type ATPase n=1 Tax=Rhodovulum sp. YNF3179 TaxID=3425127 RepID=UPI003D33DF9C
MARDLTAENALHTTTLRIEGMSCASCVGRVERAIAGADGVEEASVNLAAGTARVRYHAPTDPASLAETVERTGYHVETARIALDVAGASCASCVGRIEKALAAVPGVVRADMNLASGRATAETLAGAVDPADLAAAVRAAGYEAHPVRDDAPDADAAADRMAAEIAGLRRATLIAALLTLPVFVMEMGGHVFPAFRDWIAASIGAQPARLIQFALTSVVLAGPGRQFFTKGVPLLMRRAPDMNSLVALGTGAAWIYSTVATFAPALLPEGTRHVYFEAAAVIVTLILLGRWLEARAKGRTGAAIRKLAGLQARTARVERDGATVELPIEDIIAGDLIQVRPGERIAVDGTVTAGRSYVDESMITGEPVPAARTAGDEVIGGTVNTTGTLTFRATRVGADTTLAQIIRMVEEAQGAKLPIQSLVDKVTAVFVPAVMAAAALTVAVWLAVGPDPALTFALVAGVAVLIIACPCAMGLATPTSIMVGTGRAAELGVLFRKGDALQALDGIGTVALDKTGTLTAGRPELTDLVVADGFTEEDVLSLVAAAESRSEHPIAAAILRGAEARGLDVAAPDSFESITGHGITADISGRRVLVGAARLLEREGIDPGALADGAQRLAGEGKTALYAAIEGRPAAVIAVADPIKQGAEDTVRALHALGLTVAMVTGDGRRTAEAIARRIGIDRVEADVLPDGKVAAVRALRETAEGGVAFVGDGINDAPALAEAEVGIAIGTGTDIAIESADVVLISGDPAGVVNALHVSRATMRNIRQNLFWAFGYNTLLIPVAAGVLYPAWGVLLSPMLAAGAMALSSVFVLSNALRLRWLGAVADDGGTAAKGGAA